MATGISNITDKSQLEIKKHVMEALYLHYGYQKDAILNKWIPGASGRVIPKVTAQNLKIKRVDFFVSKWLGAAASNFLFFDSNAVQGLTPFKSNFKDSTLPAGQFYLIAGIQLLSAAGVTGAVSSALNFGEVAQNLINNGTMDLTVNTVPLMKDQNIQNLFFNDDVIPGYCRFPQMAVLQPDGKLEVGIKLEAPAGDFWVKVSTFGYLLEE
jgi:hypothetical protein